MEEKLSLQQLLQSPQLLREFSTKLFIAADPNHEDEFVASEKVHQTLLQIPNHLEKETLQGSAESLLTENEISSFLDSYESENNQKHENYNIQQFQALLVKLIHSLGDAQNQNNTSQTHTSPQTNTVSPSAQERLYNFTTPLRTNLAAMNSSPCHILQSNVQELKAKMNILKEIRSQQVSKVIKYKEDYSNTLQTFNEQSFQALRDPKSFSVQSPVKVFSYSAISNNQNQNSNSKDQFQKQSIQNGLLEEQYYDQLSKKDQIIVQQQTELEQQRQEITQLKNNVNQLQELLEKQQKQQTDLEQQQRQQEITQLKNTVKELQELLQQQQQKQSNLIIVNSEQIVTAAKASQQFSVEDSNNLQTEVAQQNLENADTEFSSAEGAVINQSFTVLNKNGYELPNKSAEFRREGTEINLAEPFAQNAQVQDFALNGNLQSQTEVQEQQQEERKSDDHVNGVVHKKIYLTNSQKSNISENTRQNLSFRALIIAFFVLLHLFLYLTYYVSTTSLRYTREEQKRRYI